MVLMIGVSSSLGHSSTLHAAQQASTVNVVSTTEAPVSNVAHAASKQVSGDFLSYLAELVEVDGKLIHPTELEKKLDNKLEKALDKTLDEGTTQEQLNKEVRASNNATNSSDSEGEQ